MNREIHVRICESVAVRLLCATRHNAPTESFWGRLKTASLHGKKFATRREAMDAVLDWIAFYNHRRLHSTLGYLSPMQYEQRWHAAQRKKAA